MAATSGRPKSARAGRQRSAATTATELPPSVDSGPSQIQSVPLDAIVVPPRRIRRDLGDVDALALSLHLHGQLAPVIVHRVGERFHLIAGERRLEATRRLRAAHVSSGQLSPDTPATINVIVRELLPGESPREIELVENAQRRELSDAEEADALIRLVREDGRDMREVAALAGRSVGYVSKRVRMFEDPVLRGALLDGTISPALAEELLTLDDERRAEMLQLALSRGWGSKELREAVQTLQQGAPENALTDAAHGPSLPEFVPSFADDDDDDFGADEVDVERALRGSGPDASTIRERPRGLTRRILELDAILQDLRPYQLKKSDDRALRQLWMTLRHLAQAPRVPQQTQFPSLAEAEALARRR